MHPYIYTNVHTTIATTGFPKHPRSYIHIQNTVLISFITCIIISHSKAATVCCPTHRSKVYQSMHVQVVYTLLHKPIHTQQPTYTNQSCPVRFAHTSKVCTHIKASPNENVCPQTSGRKRNNTHKDFYVLYSDSSSEAFYNRDSESHISSLASQPCHRTRYYNLPLLLLCARIFSISNSS